MHSQTPSPHDTIDHPVGTRLDVAIPPRIVCHELQVRFPNQSQRGERRVLDNLDMHVEPGAIVTLLGKSGCGKSTLLRAIAGLQPLYSGEVRLEAHPAVSVVAAPAFVFQEPALLPWRTAIENVCLPLELQRSCTSAEAVERAKHWLRIVGMHPTDESKFPPQLSGGMKMRVSLARALVTEPSILLMDEPFAALDDMLRWRLNELLLEQAQSKARTIIFVTHNIAEAVFLSHRIAIMHQGRISAWIENGLPSPRTSGLRATSDFSSLYGIVSSKLAELSPE